jgi:hypothetical protein
VFGTAQETDWFDLLDGPPVTMALLRVIGIVVFWIFSRTVAIMCVVLRQRTDAKGRILSLSTYLEWLSLLVFLLSSPPSKSDRSRLPVDAGVKLPNLLALHTKKSTSCHAFELFRPKPLAGEEQHHAMTWHFAA